MIADGLIQKFSKILAHIYTAYVPLLLDMKTMSLSLDYDGYEALVASFVVRPILVD